MNKTHSKGCCISKPFNTRILTFCLIVLFCIIASGSLLAQMLSITTQNNTSCGAPNGAASASVDGTTAGYSFEWYAGSDETGTLLSVNPSVTNVAGGIYTVKAIENVTGIALAPVSTFVLDASIVPVISVQVVSHLTSCISANGTLTVSVPGPATDYTYAWYQGSSAGTGPVISASQSCSNVAAGIYTVVVTHKTSQCQAFTSATVLDQRVLPTASIEVISHAISCGIPDGSLKAVVPGPAKNYNFRWHYGAGTTGPIFSNAQTVNHLAAGEYTVVVTPKKGVCEKIVTATLFPDVSIELVANNTSCVSQLSNGSLRAVVQTPLSPAYQFSWHAGTGNFLGPILSTTQTLDNVPAGVYTLIARNKNTSCEYQLSSVVVDAVVIPTVSLMVSANVTSCASPNGSLTAIVDGPSSDYSFTWVVGETWEILPSTTPTINDLPAGTYAVFVTDTISLCEQVAYATVSDETIHPIPYVELLSNDTACSVSSVPSGALRAMVFNSPTSNYDFVWFEGAVVNEGAVLSMNSVVTHVPAGIYTVRVTDKSSGCEGIVSAMVWNACDSTFAVTNSNARQGTAEFTAEETGASALSFYPNPTKGLVSLKSQGLVGSVVLTDMMGRTIVRQNLNDAREPFTFDLTHQPSGMYVVVFTSGVKVSRYHILKE